VHIYFYIKDSDIEIATFYDMNFNPFKVGDEIYVEVEGFYPTEKPSWSLLEGNRELEKLLHSKKVKIVEEFKNMRLKVGTKPKISIEYHCELTDNT